MAKISNHNFIMILFYPNYLPLFNITLRAFLNSF